MVTLSGSPETIRAFEAGRYIGQIRSASKREYARNYFCWILKGRPGQEPERTQLLNGTLSYMAAQAVRMNLERIVGAEDATRKEDRR